MRLLLLILLATQQAHLPFLATLRSQKRGQVSQEVWPWCVVPGVLKCHLVCLCCVPWTQSVFSNTATTMIASPCPTTSPFAIFGNTQESKKGAGEPGGMAMVCCAGSLEMPSGVFVLCSMDPISVFKHCHNNDCLSLPHNKPICHFWQHSGVKKGGR